MHVVTELLLGTGVVSLWILLLAAAAFGLLATLLPGTALRVQRASARRISTRRALKWAEWPHRIERVFYRHHLPLGLLLLALAGGALWIVLTALPAEPLVRALAAGSAHRLWIDVVVTAGRAVLIVGLTMAIGVSLVVVVRPSLLKRAEQGSNRWLSTRQAMRRLERENPHINSWFQRHPRSTGLLVFVCASLLALILWPVTQHLMAGS